MSGPRPKVVPFKSSATGGAKDGADIGAPTAVLARLQDTCKALLQQLVQNLFDHTDDALFELADKSMESGEQNMYFEAMREVRIQRRGIEQALARDLQEGFRALASGTSRKISSREACEEAEHLALVNDSELEEIVAVDAMISKAEKEHGIALVALNARMAMLVGCDVSLKNNPVGPAHLCQSFFDATHGLDLYIKAKLVLFKLFDRHVISGLTGVYSAGNALLVEQGVMPKMRRKTRAPAPDFNAADDESEQVFASLQQLLGQARPQHPYLHTGQRAGLMAPGLATPLPRDMLMKLLGAIQNQQINWLVQQQAGIIRGMAPRQFDVLDVLNQLLQKKLPEHAVSIGQVEDDTINLVSMLFQFIIEDRNLAAPIKGLLARLQIPILKVAMLDRSFFGKGGHPARKLLNEVANASLGWTPVGAAERDPFYRKIEALVDGLVSGFEGDVEVFQEALTDFLAFVEMDRRRASLVEQRTIDAEDGRAKAEMARHNVQDVLASRIGQRELPEAVTRLLQDGWSNVLFLICLKEGADSENWQSALGTVDDLIESVSPAGSLGDRARLLRLLPTLLKNLRSGLSKIGFNPFEMNQLFTDLEQIHLQRLKRDESVALTPPQPKLEVKAEVKSEAKIEAKAESKPVASEPAAAPQPKAESIVHPLPVVESRTLDEVLGSREQMQNIEALDRELAAQFGDLDDLDVGDAKADVPAAMVAPEPVIVSQDAVGTNDGSEEDAGARADRIAQEHIDRLQVGGWVELQQDGHSVRCRLAAVIRSTGKFIFVNRAGVKVVENNRDGLVQAYRSGKLTVLDEGRLFDRALESVIGNLREMKGRPPV
jgi:hypothetical protein